VSNPTYFAAWSEEVRAVAAQYGSTPPDPVIDLAGRMWGFAVAVDGAGIDDDHAMRVEALGVAQRFWDLAIEVGQRDETYRACRRDIEDVADDGDSPEVVHRATQMWAVCERGGAPGNGVRPEEALDLARSCVRIRIDSATDDVTTVVTDPRRMPDVAAGYLTGAKAPQDPDEIRRLAWPVSGVLAPKPDPMDAVTMYELAMAMATEAYKLMRAKVRRDDPDLTDDEVEAMAEGLLEGRA
jgi:hypothetical protein